MSVFSAGWTTSVEGRIRMDDLQCWIWITLVFGTGNPRVWEIVRRAGNVQTACRLLREGGLSLRESETAGVRSTPFSQADEMLRYCRKKGYDVLSIDNEGYPDRLKSIFNPPPVLFCMGKLDYIDSEIALAVVGARHPSPYSVKLAKKLCEELAKVGITLVSGFALGIDSMAHQAALKNRGRTVAVLGCGLDIAYPRENHGVKSLLAKQGAVISEFFPGTRPSPQNFPQRNRIIAGLALGTLVIEASSKSGSLITADLALQQGRDLFCIPPADLFDSRYAGQIKLLRDGAVPVFSHLDILYEYYENFAHRISSINPDSNYAMKDKEDAAVFHAAADESENNAGPLGSAEDKKEASIPEIHYEDLSEEQAGIVRLLEGGALLADEIAAQTGMDVQQVLSALTELELYGTVQAQAGKRYVLRP